jgi:hypothetical protein
LDSWRSPRCRRGSICTSSHSRIRNNYPLLSVSLLASSWWSDVCWSTVSDAEISHFSFVLMLLTGCNIRSVRKC